MSELQDLADSIRSLISLEKHVVEALASISKSMTSLESYVAQQVANGHQMRNGLHELNGKLQAVMLEKSRTEQSVKRIEAAVEGFGIKLTTAVTRLDALAEDVIKGFRRDGAAIRELKGQDEITQA